jgi:hypothetical protein
MTQWRLSRRSALGFVAALFSLCLTGCSAFQSTRQIDMSPFAENTATMFAEAAKVGRPVKLNYLKPYFAIPEIQQMRVMAQPVIKGLRGIVMYSNQLVALNMTSKPDKEKNKLLRSYFKEAEAKVADRSKYDSIGITSGMMDSVYAHMEQAETFREGIDAASPLVNAIVLAMQRRLDELDAHLPVAIGAIDAQVESAYADKRRNYQDLVRLQTQYQHVATLLYDSKSGNPEALKEALVVDPSMREYFASADKPTPKEYDAAELALTTRLARIEGFLHQLGDEKSEYIQKQQEIEDIRINTDMRIKVARDAVMVWAQSHRNLGAGIAVPPLIDVAGIAGGLARKVVPLP